MCGDLRARTRVHFASLDYGPGLAGIIIGLMCRDPRHNFRRRVSLRKKDKTLDMDIMLHLPEYVPLEPEERRQRVIRRLIAEVPETIAKYKLKDFDLARFTADWTAWFSTLPPKPPRDPNAPISPDIYSGKNVIERITPPRFTRG